MTAKTILNLEQDRGSDNEEGSNNKLQTFDGADRRKQAVNKGGTETPKHHASKREGKLSAEGLGTSEPQTLYGDTDFRGQKSGSGWPANPKPNTAIIGRLKSRSATKSTPYTLKSPEHVRETQTQSRKLDDSRPTPQPQTTRSWHKIYGLRANCTPCNGSANHQNKLGRGNLPPQRLQRLRM